MPLRPDHELIFQALPPLSSGEFARVLQTASDIELSAEVLVRVYRSLPVDNENADRTLDRLIGRYERYRYMRALRRLARTRATWLRAEEADAEELYHDGILAIVKTLRGPVGGYAESSWVGFCKQRFEDAWRERIGRNGERRDPKMDSIDALLEAEDGPVHQVDTEHHVGWHGRFGDDIEAWLTDFVRRRFAACGDPALRTVGLDRFLGDPSPISGSQKKGKLPLTTQLSLNRFQVMRLIERAKKLLKEELRQQDEFEIDSKFLD